MVAIFLLVGAALMDDGTAAGPEVGKAVPELKTHQTVGDKAGQEVNWTELSKDKPTIFVFIKSDHWDRPVARVLRQIDEGVVADRQKEAPNAQIAIVWVTKDVDKAKDYLPKAQQSLKLQASSWNIFSGEVYDAGGWVLSGDVALNVVIVKENKVAWGRAFKTPEESLVRLVRAALKGEKK